MTTASATARQILDRTGQHPVLSLYLDLDPAEFATAPARATQLRSLVDEARAQIEAADTALGHEDKKALIADLEQVESFLQSDEAPVSGARAVAVFASRQDSLFEALALYEPAPPTVVIGTRPFLEPLVAAGRSGGWCVVLVGRSTARIFAGEAAHLTERGELDDDTKGQHTQGGWSQARYERSIDEEAESHLRHVAEEVRLRWEREPFETLVLGGTPETVAAFRELLHGDVRPALSDELLSLDVQHASVDDVRRAVLPLLEKRRAAAEQHGLEQLRAAQGGSDAVRAVMGIEETQRALTERRVEKLLLAPDFGADETAGDPNLRASVIEAAVRQDAEVIVFEERPPETHLREGIGAILRF